MSRLMAIVCAMFLVAGAATAQTTREAANVPAVKGDEGAFWAGLDVKTLETIEIQHNQTLKTFDTFARQLLSNITGKNALEHRPAADVMDMMFRPAVYENANIIRIKNAPLRRDFAEYAGIDAAERQRIKTEGTVSLALLMRADVQDFLVRTQSTAAFKNDAVNQLQQAALDLDLLLRGDFQPLRIIPPGGAGPVDRRWHDLTEVLGNIVGKDAGLIHGHAAPQPIEGYEGKQQALANVGAALLNLKLAWGERNVTEVNAQIKTLAQAVAAVNPAIYPSHFKRSVEVIYNRLTKLTMPGAALYFAAFVCFVVSTYSGVVRLRLWGLRLFILGFAVHTLGIGVRWWLVEKNVGNWFEAIPIKNQFESVMFSAWFGALVGLILEMRKSRGIFGAAASFVGWLSLTAIFATPYVVGRDIGGEIQQVNGVLMSYWLYIHVTAVTAAYALISMSFLLGTWWLIRYYTSDEGAARRRVDGGDTALRRERRVEETGLPVMSGGALAIGFWQTLMMAIFIKRPVADVAVTPSRALAAGQPSLLTTLDLCNLAVLQLAFWILGGGIILGAVWADQSWGRPWGWDPKETFALVTWIVYLIVVHVRVATQNKAWWTAVLSVVGFFVMLFNWIGVNFFLVGLHSYA